MERSKITAVLKEEYSRLLEVWEASVRATHHFLKEEDIQHYKPLIMDHYLDAVRLYAVRDEAGQVIGFMGVSDDQIEMLFIHPSMRGMGVGKCLLSFAVLELGIEGVDVNEQNEQAVGFYRKMGFEVVNRLAIDNEGKPYPILQMKLKDTFIF